MARRDDKPWREHQDHMPREFDQGGRRAHFRGRGAHETDEERFGDGPDEPAAPRPGNGASAESDPPIDRQATPDTTPPGGYDDYASEALFGARFGPGDWPRAYRRGVRLGKQVAPGTRPGKTPDGKRG